MPLGGPQTGKGQWWALWSGEWLSAGSGVGLSWASREAQRASLSPKAAG